MSAAVADEIRRQLGKATGSQGLNVDVAGEGASVSVEVEQCERYAAGVHGLRVTPTTPDPDVRGTAERLTQQVDVIDPLRVVEVDTHDQQAIVRSAEPEQDEAGVTYWEAVVRPDETRLNRYHKAHVEPDREAVVEPMTHKEIGRLAGQLADAVAGTADA